MPSADSGAISRPRLDFQPACEQELLSIMRTCAGSGHCVPCSPHRPKAHAYIYKDKAFGLRTRPPDRNGDATRLVDHGKARYQPSRSEFCTRVFPFPVQDACGLRDGRRRIRKGDASGAARLEQSHGRAARGGSSPPQRSATPFCQRLSKEVRTAFISGIEWLPGPPSRFCRS